MHRRHFPIYPFFLLLAGFASALGGSSTLGAWVLFAAIGFITHFSFFPTQSLAARSHACA